MAVKKKSSGWGGYREGAGRKAQFEEPADRTIRFERAELEALDEIAAEQGTTAGEVIRNLIAGYLRRRRK